MEVFVDRSCELVTASVRERLNATQVDILDSGITFRSDAVLLVGMTTSDQLSSINALRRLHQSNPHLLFYICAGSHRTMRSQLVDFARAGADKIFLICTPSDIEDLERQVLDRIAAPPPAEELSVLDSQTWPAELLRWVQYAFRNAYQPTYLVYEIGVWGQSIRRLNEALQDYDIPSFGDLWRCGLYAHVVELERRGISNLSDRAQRTQLGTATDLTRFRWRLRQSVRSRKRLGLFAARIPSLSLLRI